MKQVARNPVSCRLELYFLEENMVDDFIFDEEKAKTPGLMFSLYWFLKNKNSLGL